MGSRGGRPMGRHIVARQSAQSRFITSRRMAGRLALGRGSSRPEATGSRALRASAPTPRRWVFSAGAQRAGGGCGSVDVDHRRLALADPEEKNPRRPRCLAKRPRKKHRFRLMASWRRRDLHRPTCFRSTTCGNTPNRFNESRRKAASRYKSGRYNGPSGWGTETGEARADGGVAETGLHSGRDRGFDARCRGRAQTATR